MGANLRSQAVHGGGPRSLPHHRANQRVVASGARAHLCEPPVHTRWRGTMRVRAACRFCFCCAQGAPAQRSRCSRSQRLQRRRTSLACSPQRCWPPWHVEPAFTAATATARGLLPACLPAYLPAASPCANHRAARAAAQDEPRAGPARALGGSTTRTSAPPAPPPRTRCRRGCGARRVWQRAGPFMRRVRYSAPRRPRCSSLKGVGAPCACSAWCACRVQGRVGIDGSAVVHVVGATDVEDKADWTKVRTSEEWLFAKAGASASPSPLAASQRPSHKPPGPRPQLR